MSRTSFWRQLKERILVSSIYTRHPIRRGAIVPSRFGIGRRAPCLLAIGRASRCSAPKCSFHTSSISSRGECIFTRCTGSISLCIDHPENYLSLFHRANSVLLPLLLPTSTCWLTPLPTGISSSVSILTTTVSSFSNIVLSPGPVVLWLALRDSEYWIFFGSKGRNNFYYYLFTHYLLLLFFILLV